MKILLDMDGVLANFVGGAIKMMNKKSAPGHAIKMTIEDWPHHEYNVAKIFGLSQQEFWGYLEKHDHGFSFWASLEPYPWFEELLAIVSEVDPEYHIATSPANPNSASGKIFWLREHIENDFRRFMIGPDKYLMAKKSSILIDDHDDNIKKFVENGGNAILFPQPWNSNSQIKDKISYVKQELDKIIK